MLIINAYILNSDLKKTNFIFKTTGQNLESLLMKRDGIMFKTTGHHLEPLLMKRDGIMFKATGHHLEPKKDVIYV